MLAFPLYHKGKHYLFNSFSGMLLVREKGLKKEIHLPEKAEKILKFNHYPYLLKPNGGAKNASKKPSSILIKSYAKFLVFVCKHSFFFARLVVKIRIPVFTDAEEAITVFRETTKNKNQSDLCLPRSLFAASTSKKFKESGAVFIGVFLPSTSMHAWVIENNKQADIYDDIWINYQAVALLFS